MAFKVYNRAMHVKRDTIGVGVRTAFSKVEVTSNAFSSIKIDLSS